MELVSCIAIDCPPARVWAFLDDPANIAQWDRGVARVEQSMTLPRGVGFEFDTIAHDSLNLPDQGRMSYRITISDSSSHRCVVQLTSRTGNARYFVSAEWRFEVDAQGEGSRLTCTAAFILRRRYFLLAPLLYLKRNAILKDLEFLKKAVESYTA